MKLLKPNILFLLVDSFNAEKFFGETKTSITPNIDYLIKNGTYFSKAITVAPTTIPAISSIFTGLYPFESVKKTGKILKINDQVENYLEKLRDFGYNTQAIVPKIISLVNLNSLFNNNIEEFDSFATLYDGVEEQILKKIDSNQNPWFCYIHLMDIHGKATFELNEGPKQYDDIKFGINRYERMVSSMDIKLKKIIEKKLTLTDSNYKTSGPSKYYEVKETKGLIGFITPLSNNFCSSCNRIRLTSTGKLYMCLGQNNNIDFRNLLREGDKKSLNLAIDTAMKNKPKSHDFDISYKNQKPSVDRHMSVTGG